MNAKTRRLLEIFEEINRIPRCSKNEEAIACWFDAWARAKSFPSRRDRAGNLLITVPATPGREAAPAVVIQGHLDMVCEKTPASTHDFTRDPIRIIHDGDWIHADETTLGADNGVALALGLALAEDGSLIRPTLELLFTVDEETGLTGAKKLEPGFFRGRTLINLDSETEGVFTVGCAGGRDVTITRELRLASVPDEFRFTRLAVGGLYGGHSGIDIHRQRANALKLLARVLGDLPAGDDFRLVEIAGGTKRNAIPRDASARVACAVGRLTELRKRVAEAERTFRREYATERSLFFSFTQEDGLPHGRKAIAPEEARTMVDLLLALPHGAAQMSPDFSDLVMTSSNLAVTHTADSRLSVITSQRSLNVPALNAMSGTVRAIAALAGAQATTESEYPPWTPQLESPLLQRCREVYRGCYGKEPGVRAIHAGLECAIIGDLYPDMDMISLGPTTENAHSPNERLYVPSLSHVWDFLVALLQSLSQDR
ncbi:MAG: beta-Ala-His dipeptidase [Deltaproteobacteria bacterium]|nr:beta-Ala-His dipeptidase [Deltaproteobacteria bacterium]